MKKKPTAGQRMIESARQALAFAQGRENHGCVVHAPEDIDVKAIRERGLSPKVNSPGYRQPCTGDSGHYLHYRQGRSPVWTALLPQPSRRKR